MKNNLNSYIEDYINNKIEEKYKVDKNNLNEARKALENILKLYKESYPFRFISNYHLREFYKLVMRMNFLPELEEYKKISRENELFDTTMILPIKIKKQQYGITFPLIINISKLTRYIEEHQIEKIGFNTEDLISIMTDGYEDDYEKDNKARLEKRDILVEEKAKNPIIIMNESKVTRPTIINGNHRIIYSSKNKQSQIEAYFVTTEGSCQFTLTKDYAILYKKVVSLINKVDACIKYEI